LPGLKEAINEMEQRLFTYYQIATMFAGPMGEGFEGEAMAEGLGAGAAEEGAFKYGSTPEGRPFTRHYGTETGPVRNIPGSILDNTIKTAEGVPGRDGTTIYYDPVNDVTVVTGDGGSIVSARRGPP
jgi:hypothetical protein